MSVTAIIAAIVASIITATPASLCIHPVRVYMQLIYAL